MGVGRIEALPRTGAGAREVEDRGLEHVIASHGTVADGQGARTVEQVVLPAGRYFSMSGMVTPTTGGQTRALLMRNRLLAEHCGIAPTILTFDARPHYPRTRALLRERGELVDPVRLLNIHEYYRTLDDDALTALVRRTAPETGETDDDTDDADGPDDAAHDLAGLDLTNAVAGDVLPPLHDLGVRHDHDDDGVVFRRRYVHTRTEEVAAHDYVRPDGSVYLRMPVGPARMSPVRGISLVDRAGRVVRTWSGHRAWRHDWMSSLVGPDERAFVISDSRASVTRILPMTDERFHVIHLVHNIHVAAPRHWSSTVATGYETLLASVGRLDALVTLTRRQSDDIGERCGRTTNLHVVPNPVDIPPLPQPLPARDPHRFAVVARLWKQKDVAEAVRVFALVVAAEPRARLDIYGDGPFRPQVEAEIAAHGLGDHVVMHGHDTHARETLWTATAFVMTSRFEGYPLATLEALSRGCPVVAYDVKYGPREQITDGVDGWVVPARDRQAMADRIVELARDPEQVARMSAAARRTAARHDAAAFVRDSKTVLDAVVAAKPRRTTLEAVRLRVRRLGVRPARRLPEGFSRVPVLRRWARGRAGAGAWKHPGTLQVRATLRVTGSSRESSLDSAVVTLDAVDDRTGAVVPVPVTVVRTDTLFRLSAAADLGPLFAAAGTARHLRLRLRLVWENSAWETTLRRPRRMTPNYEVSYAPSGELTLTRRR